MLAVPKYKHIPKMAWKQFYVMSLTPGFSTSAVEGITKGYPGACALGTGLVSCVFCLLPHLFCTPAVVARASIECVSVHAVERKSAGVA